MNHFYKITFILLSIVSLLASCEVLDPEEEIPSYLRVESFKFNPNRTNITGFGSVNITDARVYVDDKELGIFEMPFTIPVLASGNSKVELHPVIKVNGISATRDEYFFYHRWKKEDVYLIKDSVVTVYPETQYKEDNDFLFIEDFENSGVGVDTTVSDSYFERVKLSTAHPERQRYICRAEMNSSQPGFKITTNDNFPIASGTEAFVELDYRCNHYFTMTIVVHEPGQAARETIFYRFNPTDLNIDGNYEWNKIYIDFSEFVAFKNGASGFGLSFIANHDEALSTSFFEIDNLKIVSR